MGRNYLAALLFLLVSTTAWAGGIGPTGGSRGGGVATLPPPFAIVQNGACAAQAVNCQVSLASAVTLGNTLVACIADGQNLADTSFVVSDASGGVWMPMTDPVGDNVQNHTANHMHMWWSRNHPAGVTTVTAAHTLSNLFVAMNVAEVGGLGAYPTVDNLTGVIYANQTSIMTGTVVPLAGGQLNGQEFLYGCGTWESFTPTVSVGNLQDSGTGDGTPTSMANAQTAAAGGLGIIGAWQAISDPSKNYGFSWTNPGVQADGAVAAIKIAPSFNNDVSYQTVTISTPTTLTPPLMGDMHIVVTLGSSTTISLAAPRWQGQYAEIDICNAAGAFIPTLNGAAGVTIRGTLPTFTGAANKCDAVGLSYFGANTWLVTGSNTNL